MTGSHASQTLQTLRLMADETRWQLIQTLRGSDCQVGELVELLGMPQNLVSYHLGLLRQAGLARTHRSEADARALYYGIDIRALEAAYAGIGAALQLTRPGDGDLGPVVFLCTGNSARSQIAEGWLRVLSGGRVAVRSAGTHPRALHPLAIEVMREVGVDIGYQRAKDLNAIADLTPAVVVTVCDRAREECTGQIAAPRQIHWSIPDPAAADIAAFRSVRDDLRTRVQSLLALASYPASLAN